MGGSRWEGHDVDDVRARTCAVIIGDFGGYAQQQYLTRYSEDWAQLARDAIISRT